MMVKFPKLKSAGLRGAKAVADMQMEKDQGENKMLLNMGNITDEDTEKLLVFVESIARMTSYRPHILGGGEDAKDCVNSLIREARDLLHKDPGV